VVTCPGAYSCNLALTKSMNLGYACEDAVKGYDDPLLRNLQINISGCPNACGQHWTAEIGFYGNARKIEGKEVPHYQMLLGGGYDEAGVMRFGLQVMSLPARHATIAMTRVLDHYTVNHQDGETFRNYVLRHKIEFFKKELLADLAKPSPENPEMFKDWGDDENFSLQLGRGECAA
jgi:sulfite reductase beta subunit-like hemoprotein